MLAPRNSGDCSECELRDQEAITIIKTLTKANRL